MKKVKCKKWRLDKPCFVDKTDKRYNKYVKQIKKRGFGDDELWSLDATIAEFILPRLKCFKKYIHGIPCCFEDNPEEWNKILDKMIYAFEFRCSEDYYRRHEDSEIAKFDEGLKLFAEYFCHLWN